MPSSRARRRVCLVCGVSIRRWQALVSFLQRHRGPGAATLDMDATLVQSHKRQAEYCYKKFKACQPLNPWWAEQQVVVHSEIQGGNVPAGYRQLQVLQASLAALPGGVDKVCLRSDTAGYQKDLLLCCGAGRDKVFGVIEFAVGTNVTAEFRRAALAAAEAEWRALDRVFDGQRQATGQEWAEVCHVPSWVGESKTRADYRFLAIREPLEQLEPGDGDQLPFPTAAFALRGRSKLFALVTNRDLPGDEVIWWSRERCGKSEEVHAVMKHDLAGGTLPSGLFGANAAWWAIMVLAHNLNAVIALPGRVIRHARRLIIRLGSEAGLDLVPSARWKIMALARGPT